MTEEEWRRSEDAVAMLDWFHRRWHAVHGDGRDDELDRILKRCWVAHCRRIWKLLPDKDSRRSVKVVERFLEGEATGEEVDAAEWKAEGALFCFQYRTDLGKIARWTEEVRRMPPDLLRDLVKPNHWGEELTTPDEILERAASFAHRATCYLGRRKTEFTGVLFWPHKPFLSAPLIRDVIGDPFAHRDRIAVPEEAAKGDSTPPATS